MAKRIQEHLDSHLNKEENGQPKKEKTTTTTHHCFLTSSPKTARFSEWKSSSPPPLVCHHCEPPLLPSSFASSELTSRWLAHLPVRTSGTDVSRQDLLSLRRIPRPSPPIGQPPSLGWSSPLLESSVAATTSRAAIADGIRLLLAKILALALRPPPPLGYQQTIARSKQSPCPYAAAASP
jgi:hypothetical protein